MAQQAAVSIDNFIFGDEMRTSVQRTRAITMPRAWRYLLLLKEAQRAGIQVTHEEMQGFDSDRPEVRRAAAGPTIPNPSWLPSPGAWRTTAG